MSEYSGPYTAFLLEHGYRSRDEAAEASVLKCGHRNLEYMDWVEARWGEFLATKDANAGPRSRYIAEYTAWLGNRSVDHQARTSVEAA